MNPLNKTIFKVILGGIIGILFGWLIFSGKHATNKQEVIISHTEILEKVEAIGRLELVRMYVQDIMEHEQVRQWLPNARSVLIIEGEAAGCIDMMKMKEENLYINKDTIKIILPAPELCYSKIDHSKSKVFDTQNHFFSGAKIIDDAYREAEKHLRNSVLKAGILNETKDNAFNFFIPFFEALGFKEIYIRIEGDTNLIHK